MLTTPVISSLATSTRRRRLFKVSWLKPYDLLNRREIIQITEFKKRFVNYVE